jgi:hypothetical protein
MSESVPMTPAQFFQLDIIRRLQLAKNALVDDPIIAQDASAAIHVSDVISDAIIAIQRWRPREPLDAPL